MPTASRLSEARRIEPPTPTVEYTPIQEELVTPPPALIEETLRNAEEAQPDAPVRRLVERYHQIQIDPDP